ncbi:hypothetical protein HYDPIDRAFT_107347 [Hydnomerulius pinastri MD-312]|nr:hypothetical protein HYDPIDRAFT_107347 [Hydnomerulius pinastri MD-312]
MNLLLQRGIYLTRDSLLQSPRCTRRHASGSSNPFPYPTQPNPQPHHIFHLPRSATQQQIKERYYDLVRIYHPDSPIARHSPPEVAQARFQSISKAYDLMRGKSSITGESLASQERHMDPARFRARASRRPYFDDAAGDERWKERMIVGATVLTIAAFFAQATLTRQQAIAESASRIRSSPLTSKRTQVDEALAESIESFRSRPS